MAAEQPMKRSRISDAGFQIAESVFTAMGGRLHELQANRASDWHAECNSIRTTM
jgi:hypothetical protein